MGLPPRETPEPVSLKKGEGLGRFNMGSTVILLFDKDAIDWVDTLYPGADGDNGTSPGKLESDITPRSIVPGQASKTCRPVLFQVGLKFFK
jgi:phosphatidylserine decarboxylase